MNDTSWFSDVILPEASYLERYDPLLPVGDKAFIRQPVIEPQGEAKSALWIYKQLGERLGLGDYFQYEDEEDYIRQQLAPLGTSLEEVKVKGYAEIALPSVRCRTLDLNRERSAGTLDYCMPDFRDWTIRYRASTALSQGPVVTVVQVPHRTSYGWPLRLLLDAALSIKSSAVSMPFCAEKYSNFVRMCCCAFSESCQLPLR